MIYKGNTPTSVHIFNLQTLLRSIFIYDIQHHMRIPTGKMLTWRRLMGLFLGRLQVVYLFDLYMLVTLCSNNPVFLMHNRSIYLNSHIKI